MESEKDLLQTYYDEVIYLLKCGFHNTKYQLNENIDYKKLFAVARKHKVANLLFSVLKDAELCQKRNIRSLLRNCDVV